MKQLLKNSIANKEAPLMRYEVIASGNAGKKKNTRLPIILRTTRFLIFVNEVTI